MSPKPLTNSIEAQLWRDALVACLRAGHDVGKAEFAAVRAVHAFRAYFDDPPAIIDFDPPLGESSRDAK